jgi:peptidoglycan/LPS O-acetylase OafA/YrhL
MVFGFHAQLFHFGSTGVAFFFVLSGFVLTWGYQPGRTARQFYLRRFARVYPLHLLVWILLVTIPWLAVKPNTDWLKNIVNLFLLQSWTLDSPHQLTVALVTWSLSCEAFFYLVFPWVVRPLLNLTIRNLWIIVGGIFLVVETLIVAFTNSPMKWVDETLYVNPLVRLPEFLVGIAIGLTLKAGVRICWYWGIAPLIISATGLVFMAINPAMNVWGAFGFAVVIAAFAQWDIAGTSRITTNRAFVYAGKVSFAFYLVHLVALTRVNHSMVGFGIPHVHLVAQVVSLLSAVIVAILMHHLVEQPVHNWILRKPGGKTPAAVTAR